MSVYSTRVGELELTTDGQVASISHHTFSPRQALVLDTGFALYHQSPRIPYRNPIAPEHSRQNYGVGGTDSSSLQIFVAVSARRDQ